MDQNVSHRNRFSRGVHDLILLSWKNWLLIWRHKCLTILQILFPLLFFILLVPIRIFVEVKRHKEQIYPPYQVDIASSVYNMSYRVVWSPCGNEALSHIMETVAGKHNMIQQCMKSSTELQVELVTNVLYTLAGVDFGDDAASSNIIDKNIRIILRFPAELRTSNLARILAVWNTDLLFEVSRQPGPRNHTEITGAQPNYYNEGFLTLQYDISTEIIKYHLKKNNKKEENLPTVMMQRFPYPNWKDDMVLTFLEVMIDGMILYTFIFTWINTIKLIVKEKENQMKEEMKILGLSKWLHWTSWFLRTFFIFCIAITFFVTLLKISLTSNEGSSLLPFTDPWVLFVLLLCYAFAMITAIFLVSLFVKREMLSTYISLLVWIALFVPSFITTKHTYTHMNLSAKLCAMISFNTALVYGFRLIMKLENAGIGSQWNNLFSTIDNDSLTMGHVMIMLLFDSVLYMILTLYIEAIFPGEYGVPQVWYYPFNKCRKRTKIDPDKLTEERLSESDTYEKEPTGLEAGIKIRNLTKVYPNKTVAVKDMSLTMFKGQITVLLGHNGAGKTTLISVLTGMKPLTSGKVLINGYDVSTEIDKVRRSLGYCAQNNILFAELTVREHLYFFSRLRGMKSRKELKVEVNKFIELLELVPKAKTPSKNLSGGMKRKLCFAIALCGKANVCLFDEPTAGMDPSARRIVWNILQSQKEGRTILLCTHHMDEADILGDRIAIMTGGQLQSCGTSFFLKKKYGVGYRLVIEKGPKCNTNTVTLHLKNSIPSIVLVSDIGSELTYILPKEESGKFKNTLQNLENNMGTLDVKSFGVSVTTMEDVFIKINTAQGFSENPVSFESQMKLKAMISESTRLKGLILRWNQFLAMMMKKILFTINTWIILLIQILLPIILLIINSLSSASQWDDPARLDLSLVPYDNPTTVVSTSDVNNGYYLEYIETLKSERAKFINWNSSEIVNKILEETIKAEHIVRIKYIIGSSFSSGNNTITALFNNIPFHSPPLSLQYVMNAILREKMYSNDYSISVTNYPLPYSAEFKALVKQEHINTGEDISYTVSLCMVLIIAFYIIFCIKDRAVKSKHLQYVSGVGSIMYWMTTYLWDMITYTLICCCLLLTVYCLQIEQFSTSPTIGYFFFLLIVFGFAALSVTYMMSFIFQVPTTGFTIMLILNFFLGSFLYTLKSSIPQVESWHWGFMCLPHYALTSGLTNMSRKGTINKACRGINEQIQEKVKNMTGSNSEINFACELERTCCDIDDDFLEWGNFGIGYHLYYLGLVGLILATLLILCEIVFSRIRHICRCGFPKDAVEPDDADVLEENRKVRAGEIDRKDYHIVLKDLSKVYRGKVVVNKLCLGIKGSECFGLLGVNGAGKTTTFRMMTGDISITKGDAWIYGWNIKIHVNSARKHIGYCPQFDALLDDLTGKQTLIMYGLVRGISLKDIKTAVHILAREFDFNEHLNKRIRYYSGGTKRKLSAAIAVIGDSPIIFLDEPTAGMDPTSRRKIWNAFCFRRDKGACLILTTHIMEECEALCTRVAIMVTGGFKCLGTTQHVKNKFHDGFQLTIKVAKPQNREIDNSDIEPVIRYVTTNVPNATLEERHQDLLIFAIKGKDLKWSTMFGIMEDAKKKLNIEDYSLGQSSLEQLFLSLATAPKSK